MTTASDVTPACAKALFAFGHGEQPDIQPIVRRWIVSHGYIVPTAPPRPPREARGRRKISPRAHALTELGRWFVLGHGGSSCAL